MVDFGAGQRAGFIEAFVSFWQDHPSNLRTMPQLRNDAKNLLKGCVEHFRAGVVRVSNISGAIHPADKHKFRSRTLGLLEAKDHEDFVARAEVVMRDYPMSISFLSWWLMSDHAEMLFPTERKMDLHLSLRLPDSTNAEEAQHNKLYVGVGRKHALIDGLRHLASYLKLYHRQYLHASSESWSFKRYTYQLIAQHLAGGKIRYGMGEPWKIIYDMKGRTHPSRSPAVSKAVIKKYHNDGRRFDTAAELLGKKARKKGQSS